jgi:DNA repair protein RadC
VERAGYSIVSKPVKTLRRDAARSLTGRLSLWQIAAHCVPHIALPRLRRLVAEHGDLAQALRCPTSPQDVLAVLKLLRAMLQPNPRDQIKSPTDAAGLLMLDMSALDQEHLRTVLLDTKNRV